MRTELVFAVNRRGVQEMCRWMWNREGFSVTHGVNYTKESTRSLLGKSRFKSPKIILKLVDNSFSSRRSLKFPLGISLGV